MKALISAIILIATISCGGKKKGPNIEPQAAAASSLPFGEALIVVNNNDTSTKSLSVTLKLTAASAVEMYITNTPQCADGASWEAFAKSKADWKLAPLKNGDATVYAKFKNSFGIESECVQDSIAYKKPASSAGNGSVQVGGGTGQTNNPPPDTIVDDDIAPQNASISINNGASATNSATVTLTLSADDATEMYISNTAGCGSGGSWETYATSKANWTLGQANQAATVYVKFKDALGNETTCINDTITHDSTAPQNSTISINSGASATNSATVTLTLSADDATEMYISNTAGCGSGGSWETYATSKANWTLGQANQAATVYVKFKDALGNETACINDTITHDSTAPQNSTISINSGASSTNSATVTLTLSADDATEMYISNTAGCGSGGSWETYATSKANWTLGQANQAATVYVKFKDALGNETTCINDTITHDNTAPQNSTISINSGASSTNSATVTLTLSADDATEMYISNTAGCGSGGSWETYATSKANWTLGQANQAATVYVKFKDALGNETTCINDTITHDDIAPQNASISINSGASSTSNSTVTLTLSADDATEMYITNTSGCASGGSWETYATSKANWSHGLTFGTATVYAKFRDSLSNESSCINDTITKILSQVSLSLSDPQHSPSNDTTPTFQVTGAEIGATVAIYKDNNCQTQVATQVANATTIQVAVPAITVGTYQFSGLQIDTLGTPSLCSQASVSYQLTTNTWTWVNGDDVLDQPAVFGTKGVAASGNNPGRRSRAANWVDGSGKLWLFGGAARDKNNTVGYLNDLWSYDIATGLWTWVSGDNVVSQSGVYGTIGQAASSNKPGSRRHSTGWMDSNGIFWIFGGEGYDTGAVVGYLNDLWSYDPATGFWTWVSGANAINQIGVYGTKNTAHANNHPGSRARSSSWVDSNNKFWIYGGNGLDTNTTVGYLNDLWKFDSATGLWTWVAGNQTINLIGDYGTKGVADANNVPAGRYGTIVFKQSNDDVWMFAGTGNDLNSLNGRRNDLWFYDHADDIWTWMFGDTTRNVSAVSGTKGVEDAANKPGSREHAANFIDSDGNLWVFGGAGFDRIPTLGNFNDLWRYKPTTNQWTWIHGDDLVNQFGVYGTKGLADSSNKLGGRVFPLFWTDKSKNFWVYGGEGRGSTSTSGGLRDLWKYAP